MSYATGDGDITKSLTARFSSEREVTPEFVVNEATEIFKKARQVPNTEEDNDRFLADMRKEHPQFGTSYPVVLRHICQLRAYSPKVLKLWLDKIARNPWTTEDEYLEAQVDYTCMLYRHQNPRTSPKDLRAHRDGVRKMLLDEHKKFKKYAADFTDKITAMEEESRARNKAELLEYCAGAPHEMPRAGTVTSELVDDVSDVAWGRLVSAPVDKCDLGAFDITADLLLDDDNVTNIDPVTADSRMEFVRDSVKSMPEW